MLFITIENDCRNLFCILKEFSLRFFLDIFSVNYSVNYGNNNLNLKLKEKHKFEFSIFVISLI